MDTLQALFVQRLNHAIHWILVNRYPSVNSDFAILILGFTKPSSPYLTGPQVSISMLLLTLLIFSSSRACCTILSLKPLRRLSAANAESLLQANAST